MTTDNMLAVFPNTADTGVGIDSHDFAPLAGSIERVQPGVTTLLIPGSHALGGSEEHEVLVLDVLSRSHVLLFMTYLAYT
jgi:hypothetical protein